MDDHETDGGTVSKQILSEKLKSGNRGLKTETNGRSPWRRRRPAFYCSDIEEEEEEDDDEEDEEEEKEEKKEEEKKEEEEEIVEFLLRRKCEQSGLTILTLKENVFSNYVFVVQLSRNNDNTSYYFVFMVEKVGALITFDVTIQRNFNKNTPIIGSRSADYNYA